MLKILIIGSSGQLGSALMNEFWNHLSDYQLIGLNSKNADITDEELIKNLIKTHSPDWVINTAAYTNVEKAEIEPRPCYELNVFGVDNVIKGCIESNCGLIQISTDYVFGSKQRKVITEYDEPNPLNNYGMSKLAAEILVKNNMSRNNLPWYIVRSSSLYGKIANSTKGTFILNMLKKIKNNEKVYLNDLFFMSPTNVEHLSHYIRKLINKPFGIYHASNFGTVTPYAFVSEAVYIINKHDLAKGYNKSNIILDNKVTGLAERPRFSFLGTDNNIGISMPTWDVALEEFLILNKEIL